MVLKNLLLYAALVALVLTASCKEEIDTNPPESPNLLPHTADTDTLPVEVGTDAVPECECILLEWIANTEEDLKEYEIFRSTHKDYGFYPLFVVTDTKSTYRDDNLDPLYTRYYYYMVARDHLGNTSDPSSTVDYQLTRKAVLSSPAGGDTVFTDSVRFEWTWDGNRMGEFLVRLYSCDADSIYWIGGWIPAYQDPLEAYSPSLPVGEYKWRVDYVEGLLDALNKGSESSWVSFHKE